MIMIMIITQVGCMVGYLPVYDLAGGNTVDMNGVAHAFEHASVGTLREEETGKETGGGWTWIGVIPGSEVGFVVVLVQ